MSASLIEQAREALRLAESDPGRSAAFGRTVAQRARVAGDAAAAAIAERALGLAALHSEDLDTSMRHLRAAVGFGRRAGSPQLAALARMTLAFALNSRGHARPALREIDTALTDLRGVERAQGQAQRGAILMQLGRYDEALAILRTALRALRRAGDDLWTFRVLLNRGVLHGYRLELTAAETDLRDAERLCRGLGLDLSAAYIQQNLGWVNAVRGDVPVALRYFDSAEQRFRALNAQLGSVLSDRSELLLSVRLVQEAREVAEAAVEELDRERRRINLPEVRLVLARAATLDGDHDLALDQARRATREFTRQQRPEWAELARFATLSSRLAGTHRAGVTIGQVEQAAARLEAARWPAPTLEARLLAAELALERGAPGRGQQQLRYASRARSRGPASLRARAWYAEGMLRLATGNRRGALAAVRTGLRVLDEHRATLGATDLRAHASGHRTDLAELGLRIALEDRRPRRVFAWAEQGRASHLLLPSVRPPDDPTIAHYLAELRATMTEIVDARRAGRGAAKLGSRRVALERRIRDYCRKQLGDPGAQPIAAVPPEDLAGALGRAALVEFVQLDGVLHVLTVVDGRVRVHRLGPMSPIRDLADRSAFAVRRLGRHRMQHPSHAEAAAVLLRHSAERLDEYLFGPIRGEIRDRPLVVVPTGPLQSLLWSTLPSCAGRPVAVSPSATIWYSAMRRAPGPARAERAPTSTAPRAGGRAAGRITTRHRPVLPDPAAPIGPVVVAAGPDLPGAAAEADAVAAIYNTKPLVGSSATVDAVTGAMTMAGLAHLAAHGRVCAPNPLFSSLEFADGPLMAYDLERLWRVPPTVVLAACDSGRHVVRAGDELLGLGATFLSHGARHLIGSVVPVADIETTPLMVALHGLLAAGRPPADALATAQERASHGEPAEVAAAAAFVCIGAGLA
jgi:tetratricopeptide (TPR) repeat protein